MRANEFNQMVKQLKEDKSLKVKDLEQCTVNQLIKVEDVMLDMQLDKNLEKVLDIVTDMVISATTKVANKKNVTKEVVSQEVKEVKEVPNKAKKAPNKDIKEVKEVPSGIEYKSLKLGDIVTIYNNDIIDTHTTIIFKSATMVVAVDIEDEVSYEFKKEFIEEGGYKFKGKNYFLRLGR